MKEVIVSLPSGSFTAIGKQTPGQLGQSSSFNVQNAPPSLTYPQAIRQAAHHSLPFLWQRLIAAGFNIASGVVISSISPSAVAAAPLTTTIQYAFLASPRMSLQYVNQLLKKAAGKLGKEQSKPVMGQIVRQSWLYCFLTLGISLPALLSSPYFLSAIGIPANITDQVKAYFYYFSPGVLPIMWTTSDSQFSLGADFPTMKYVMGSAPWLVSAAISFPMALGLLNRFNFPSGNEGLGTGGAIAAWLVLIATRIYYLANSFQPYELYSCQNYTDQLGERSKLAAAFGLQTFSEWANLLGISILSGLIGHNALAKEQTSIQLITTSMFLLMGFSGSVNGLVSKKRGAVEAAIRDGINSDANKDELIKLGDAGIIVGLITATIIASVFFWGLRGVMSDLFTHDDHGDDIIQSSKSLLLINGFGLIADALRNTAAGALSGLDEKEARFAPKVSFLIMTCIGLPAGFGLAKGFNDSVEALFITRNISILLSALIICHRWYQKSRALRGESNNSCCQNLSTLFNSKLTQEASADIVYSRMEEQPTLEPTLDR